MIRIPFEAVVAKIRHAFTAKAAGQGLLTPCNKMLKTKTPTVYLLQSNQVLRAAVIGCKTLLQKPSYSPT